MKKGLLTRLRRHSVASALAFAALVLTLIGPFERPAHARLDPLRIVTTQIVQPNILVVIDTSGSMYGTPDSSDTSVGSDCYHGEKCTSTASQKCQDGTTSCKGANTCATSGASCTLGGGGYCPTGAGSCTATWTCGSAGSYTACPSSTATCSNGGKCYLCGDNITRCTTTSDCPTFHPPEYCRATFNSSGCDGSHCSTGVPCNCGTNNNRECTGWCASTGTGCRTDDDCNYGDYCSSTMTLQWVCQTGTVSCANGSACAQWCSGGTQQCAQNTVCSTSLGACNADCADGSACLAYAHCSGRDEPCFPLSSRLGLAKHVAIDVINASQGLANFGLMSFDQTGYFQYTNGTSSTAVTRETYFSYGQLSLSGNFSASPPATMVPYYGGGTSYTNDLSFTLGSGNNSVYSCNGTLSRVPFNGTLWQNGSTQCSFQGSYYNYSWSGAGGSGSTKQSNVQPCQGHTYTTSCSGCTLNDNDSNGGTGAVVKGWDGNDTSCSTSSDTNQAEGLVRVPIQIGGDQSSTLGRIAQWLSPVDQGGLAANGSTPTGCILASNLSSPYTQSFGSSPTYRDAASYLSSLETQANDPNYYTCRKSSVIIVTDGEPNGPGDSSCNATNCTPTSSGLPSGCACHAVKSAYYMSRYLGIKVFVVGLSSDVTATAPMQTLNNMAMAGGGSWNGTSWTNPATVDSSGNYAYFSSTESSLASSLQSAVFQAAQGDYTTGAPSVATTGSGTVQGNVALLTSTEFPAWKGHLRAFDLVNHQMNCAGTTAIVDSNGNPVPNPLWDAGCMLRYRDWKSRRVATADGSNNLVWFGTTADGSPGSGTSMNTSTLYTAFTAAGVASADRANFAKWIMGYDSTNTAATTPAANVDACQPQCTPATLNTLPAGNAQWKLGTVINSVPVTEARWLTINAPGHSNYVNTIKATNRPQMAYVGADDGMVHAFYLESYTHGANSYTPGTEAWAYMPPEVISNLYKLYLAGSQPGNPSSHIYGVASSAKLLDVCNGACSDTTWHTLLVSGLGPGGSAYFGLDIGSLPDANPPIAVAWRTSTLAGYTGSNNPIGQSWSVPAFAFPGAPNASVSRILFGSGYDPTPDNGTDNTGNYVTVADAWTGVPIGGFPYLLASPATNTNLTDTNYAVLADTAVTRDLTGWTPNAAYQADLAGRIWRLDAATGTPTAYYNPGDGGSHPLYYSPAVSLQAAGDIALPGTTVVAAMDSTYDDAVMNPITKSCSLDTDCTYPQTCLANPVTGGTNPAKICTAPTPRATILYEKSGAVTNTFNIPVTSMCATVKGDGGVATGCFGSTCNTSTCTTFTNTARPVGSPLLLENTASNVQMLQALYLIYQPQTACNLGETVLVVVNLGTTGATQSASVVMTTQGKATGLVIGGGGDLLVATPGIGSGSSAGLHTAANKSALSITGSMSAAKVLGLSEKDED